jgi:hypothetical protein
VCPNMVGAGYGRMGLAGGLAGRVSWTLSAAPPQGQFSLAAHSVQQPQFLQLLQLSCWAWPDIQHWQDTLALDGGWEHARPLSCVKAFDTCRQ